MLLRNGIESVSKQLFCLRPFLAQGSQTSWYSTKNSLVPSPPKRNRSAWLWFVSDTLPTLKKEHPDRKPTELLALAGEKWRQVDPTTLEKYQKAALKDKQQYVEALESYNASLTPEVKLAMAKAKENEAKSKQKKQLKAMGMPKKPPNAYILFSTDYLKKNSSSMHCIKDSSKVASIWASLSDSEKSKWSDLAAVRERDYKKKLQQWESEMVAKGHLEVVDTKTKR